MIYAKFGFLCQKRIKVMNNLKYEPNVNLSTVEPVIFKKWRKY